MTPHLRHYTARERLKRFAADPAKRMQYDSEDQARIQHNTEFSYTLKRGYSDEGHAEGHAEAREQMILSTIPKLRAAGLGDELICSTLSLSDEEIKRYIGS